MKKRNVLLKTTAVCCSLALLFTGCGISKSSAAPFTNLSFDSTIEDMYEQEGNDYSTKDSVYGDTYVYDCTYNEMDGSVSYSFDDETLSCVSFLYTSDDGDDITEKYETLHLTLEKKYGESGEYKTDSNTYKDIWRLKNGNIMLIGMVSSDYNAILYTYLNPDYSTLDPDVTE